MLFYADAMSEEPRNSADACKRFAETTDSIKSGKPGMESYNGVPKHKNIMNQSTRTIYERTETGIENYYNAFAVSMAPMGGVGTYYFLYDLKIMLADENGKD